MKSSISKIINSNLDNEKKIIEIISLVFQRQNKTDLLIGQSFNGLTIQNSTLFEQNEELKKQVKSIQHQLDLVFQQLQEKLKQEKLIEERRMRRKNRKKKPSKKPMTEEIYNFLIRKAILIHRETYYGARLQLALVLLLVIGVGISEILTLKVFQIKTLFNESWVAIS